LNGFFSSKRGQFKLEVLESGGPRLVGTTWYCHNMWPEAYWRLWSDPILHAIHRRVLNHIKHEVEEERS